MLICSCISELANPKSEICQLLRWLSRQLDAACKAKQQPMHVRQSLKAHPLGELPLFELCSGQHFSRLDLPGLMELFGLHVLCLHTFLTLLQTSSQHSICSSTKVSIHQGRCTSSCESRATLSVYSCEAQRSARLQTDEYTCPSV